MTKKFLGINLKRKTFFFRFLRFLVSVVVISALLLGISALVREASTFDLGRLSGITSDAQNTLSSSSVASGGGDINAIINGIVSKIKIPDLSFKTLFGKLVREAAKKVVSTDTTEKKVLLHVCILADIHQDTENLSKVLNKSKDLGCAKFLIIGDITNYGDIDSLRGVKSSLDLFGAEYYVIPGDHDLAQSVSVDNFIKVFGQDYQLVDISGVKFLMLDNSANYTLMDSKQIAWLNSNILNADYVLLSQPLYVEGLNAPFNQIFMGSTRTPPTEQNLIEKQQAVKEQGKFLLALIEKTGGIKAVFAGEHHRSNELADPVRADLKHHVIGAVSSTVDIYPQSVIQTSRFSLLKIFEDKTYSIEDVTID